MMINDRPQILRVVSGRPGMGEYDDVDAVESFLAQPEHLPDDALDPVTDHGAARTLARNRNAETGVGELIRAPVYREMAG